MGLLQNNSQYRPQTAQGVALDPGSTAETPAESTTHQFESTDTGLNDSDWRSGDGEGTTVPAEGLEGPVSRFVGHRLPEQAASMICSESSSPLTQKTEVVTSDEDAGGLTGGSNGSQEFPCLGALQRLSVQDEELSVQDLHISEAFVTDNDGLFTVSGSSTGCSISRDVSVSSSSLGNFEDISHSQIASLASTAPESVVQSWPLRDGGKQSTSGVQTSEVQDPITSHTPDRINAGPAVVCIDNRIALLAVGTFVKRYRPTELLRNPIWQTLNFPPMTSTGSKK